MHTRRRLVVGLLAVIALTMSQAVSVLHGVTHERHHDDPSHVLAGHADAQGVASASDDDGDHEQLHSSAPASPSVGKSLLPAAVLVAQLVLLEPTGLIAPPLGTTRPQPRPYVAPPPDQPRAPPVG